MKSNKLSVLFLASWYPSKEHQTLGNFVQRHAKAAALINDVTVVSAHASDTQSIEIDESDNVTEIRVYFKRKLPLFSYQKAMKAGISEAYKRAGDFDLAHVHVAYPAGVLALNLDIPFVVTEHFSGYHPQSGFKWRFGRRQLTDRILSRARMILPVSDHLGKAIHHFGVNTRMIQVSNVVDENIFFPTDEPADEFRFIHISTLEERSKNITGILRGFKNLEKTNPNFILSIGGDGDLKELEEKIKEHGPSRDKVELISEQPIEGIANLMRSSSCLVMFSHFENQPCTILEALCCGLPIISSDVGGIPEVLSDDNGLLIPAEDEAAFAEGLIKMMNSVNKYKAHHIAKEAHQLYSYQAVAKRLNEIYVNVLN